MSEPSTSAGNGHDAAAPVEALLERPRLTFDLDVDICVIGAGLAGLTVAREAARLGASVAVLEGRHVGWNASGHQLGTVMPGFGVPLSDLIERIGFETARELWALSRQGAEYVRAAATLVPFSAFSEGALEVSNVDIGDRLISRLQMLAEDFDTEVEGWQVDRVRTELKTRRYFHRVYYPKAFQIDGHRYLHGLAGLARQAGPPRCYPRPRGVEKRRRPPHLRGYAGGFDRCVGDPQAHRHAASAAARVAYCPRRQYPPRRSLAPAVGNAAAGVALCGGDRAAWRTLERGDDLPGLGER